MPRLGAVENPTGDEHLRRKATVLRCGRNLGEQRDGAATGVHLGVDAVELATQKDREEDDVAGEEGVRGGAPRCAPWFVHPVVETCKEKTREGLGVVLANAGSRIDGRRRRIQRNCPTATAEQGRGAETNP